MARRSSRRGLAAALAGLALLAACHRREPAARASAATTTVPRRVGAITIDGEWDELDWTRVALRGRFLGDDGRLARPSSEVRLVHDNADLFVALYAADEDIESVDAFDLTVGAVALHVDATGKLDPALPGVRAAVDFDEGTRDDARDDDEEWVVELAVPLTALGWRPGQREAVRAARCDVPKDKIRRCGSFTASLGLE